MEDLSYGKDEARLLLLLTSCGHQQPSPPLAKPPIGFPEHLKLIQFADLGQLQQPFEALFLGTSACRRTRVGRSCWRSCSNKGRTCFTCLPGSSGEERTRSEGESGLCDITNSGVRETEKWLQTALSGGFATAQLHLAHLAFDTGREDAALTHLQEYLSRCVEKGRNWCAGCSQTRGEDAQMLTCGGCRVARFCSADHQKMASKSVASGGDVLQGRHKNVCDILGKWRRQVVKDGMPPDACSADLLAFLRLSWPCYTECIPEQPYSGQPPYVESLPRKYAGQPR